MIRFECPGCGKGVAVKDEAAGTKGKCPGCGETLEVPIHLSAVSDKEVREEVGHEGPIEAEIADHHREFSIATNPPIVATATVGMLAFLLVFSCLAPSVAPLG